MKVDKTKWEKKTLGEVCSIKRGGSPRPIKKYITDSPSGINWIKIGDAGNSKYISACKEKIIPEGISKSRYVHKGDFLLSNSMSFGRPYILNVDGCIHDGWLVLEKPVAFDTTFLYYLLSSNTVYEEFSKRAKGAVVNNLNIELVSSVPIRFPQSITEQRAIAAELDAVQKMIEGYKAQLADLDTLAQSIFLDMFGDPITNPKRWEKEPIHNFCKIIRGPFGGSLKKECFVPTGFAVYEQQNAIYNTFSFRYFIDEQKFNELKRFSVIPNDLIMSCAGTMGKIAIVPQTAPKGIINQALMKISIIKDLNVIYLKFLMESSLFQDSIENQAKGVAMKNVAAVRTIKNVLIPIPPLPLQQQFAERVESIERQKELLQAQLAEAQTLMDERMQYYFD